MDARFMDAALAEAEKAASEGEIPVGAVIVKDGAVIARGHNRREATKSTFSHAECEAVAAANKSLGDWRLDGCSIYVTLEPCAMCLGALISARVEEIVFGAFDHIAGAVESRQNIGDFTASPPKVFAGIRERECTQILEKFFKELR